MSDTIDKIYQSPVTNDDLAAIESTPVEVQSGIPTTTTNTPNKVYTPGQQLDVQFPEKVIAREVISTSFDTQTRRILGTFELGQLGGIRIGKYESGVSGEVSITPNGIMAKNVNGVTTFTLDGTTGDATFFGTIAAGTVIAGSTQVGDTANVTIDGANKRILINDGTNDRILIGYQLNGF